MQNIFFRLQRVCGMMAFFVIGLMTAGAAGVRTVDFGGETWDQIKGKHFIVFYHPAWDKNQAMTVLRTAERYYQTIGEAIGFTRRSDFWTWDDRAKIFIFRDQTAFTQRTGAPAWTTGYSDRDSFLFESRAIVTYQQEAALIDEILPHEISHLIIHDFIEDGHLPVWIDEGIAQLYEAKKVQAVGRLMRFLISQGQHIHLDFLNQWDIRKEKDRQKIEIFYSQSLSVIYFLRETYGHGRFRDFCRHLRDGKDVNAALRGAYLGKIESLGDLERLWVEAMRQ